MKASRLTQLQEGCISDVEDVEKPLITWIEDQKQKCITLSTMIIMAKGKNLFVMVKEKAGPNYGFEVTACSGRFKQLKKCYSSHIMKVNGEFVSTHVKATEKFLATLDKLIVEE